MLTLSQDEEWKTALMVVKLRAWITENGLPYCDKRDEPIRSPIRLINEDILEFRYPNGIWWQVSRSATKTGVGYLLFYGELDTKDGLAYGSFTARTEKAMLRSLNAKDRWVVRQD